MTKALVKFATEMAVALIDGGEKNGGVWLLTKAGRAALTFVAPAGGASFDLFSEIVFPYFSVAGYHFFCWVCF